MASGDVDEWPTIRCGDIRFCPGSIYCPDNFSMWGHCIFVTCVEKIAEISQGLGDGYGLREMCRGKTLI